MDRLKIVVKKGRWIKKHWQTVSIVTAAVIVVATGIQAVYMTSHLPPGTSIGGVNIGGMDTNRATKLIKKQFSNLNIALYMGNGTTPYKTPTLSDVGVSVDLSASEISNIYPAWVRFVPTSILWARVMSDPTIKYSYKTETIKKYVVSELGKSCDVKPINATVYYKDGNLGVEPAVDGGTCKVEDVEKILASIKPTLRNNSVYIDIKKREAKVQDEEATEVVSDVTERTLHAAIMVGNKKVDIPQADFLSWLDFKSPDSGITVSVNSSRAAKYLGAHITPMISVAAGRSKITTHDFTVVSSNIGKTGQTLDVDGTVKNLNDWVNGKSDSIVAQVASVAPAVTYTRSYSSTDTGLNAMLQHYAETHNGVYGISYAEIGGASRHGGYKDTQVFETASTYKLFVAYSTLKNIESGKWKWTDKNIAGGRDRRTCFDDMIEKSDNACAEALLYSLGQSRVTKDIQAIGLTHSTFTSGNYIQSTPADETKFLGMLETGQILNSTSRNILISAMKKNIYRSGVPSGTSATVADKVGFLYGHIKGVSDGIQLYHDAAIVYSKSGTYVLTVMTGGSTWGNIADITRHIESWRAS